MSYFAAPSFSIPNRAIPERSLPGWILFVYAHGTVFALVTDKNISGVVRKDVIDIIDREVNILSIGRTTQIDEEEVRFMVTGIDSESRMTMIKYIDAVEEIEYRDVITESPSKERTTSIVSDIRTTEV